MLCLCFCSPLYNGTLGRERSFEIGETEAGHVGRSLVPITLETGDVSD